MSKHADHKEHVIDDAVHVAHIALHQRFDALKAQLGQVTPSGSRQCGRKISHDNTS
jgi:hypothetical protein